uniref:Uncharacterized mitochondrial protein AtMg00810-like n=1 Tax=Tanacetum cinerariifolium TaxID=118510 RepID=A0A6L2LMN6_TANCI|nr:uncharacterized mitochondrial protein AtMg00810-like [Tanacetum cinerariifolium]
MTHSYPHRHVVPTAVLTRSRLVPFTATIPVTTAVPQTKVEHQRPTKHGGNPQHALKDKGVIDSGYSRHMIWNISYLFDFEEINGGYVAFGRNPRGGKIIGKGKIRIGKLDFDDVYFVKELKFNLFSVSQMCDKKNNVLFTNIECIVLSSNFKLPNENHVLLRVPGENNTYNVDLKNIVPTGDLTCIFTKATLDESNLWHRRLGHINFKTMNKLVKRNLVRGLPSKVFENNHTCVACKKGKQHRASWIKREFSVAGTPQQNGIAKRKNMTLIKVARTMLADLLLPIPFWAEAVNTACYVQNKVLVTKPHNKTPYELLLSRTPSIGFMRPFACPVTILNTLDLLDKFDGKAYEGFLVGYSVRSGPIWLFDIDALTQSMNYQPVVAGNQPNSSTFTAVGLNLTNITNTFSAAGPSNNVVSLNFKLGGKSLYVDPSQYPDDPDMPALEDITYLDDKEDVSAEADFSNLETNITVNPIPTTRVHKDHPITQIIGGLSSTPQTKSMTRMVKEQGFEDPDYPNKDYKVVKALYGFHQALRAWYETLDNYLLENGFQRGKIDQTLFINKQKASTTIDTEKPLLKDPDGEDVDLHTYRLMIGSLMYLTSSRLDIMFAVYACAHFQVTPKASHLHAVKRIFRYLKGNPHLGLWYPKNSPFSQEASDSDYARASLDRKSTIGGCQFLGYRLVSWQCKKQTVVATSSTKAKYVAAASCCAQVLWIQNQLLDYSLDQTVSGKDSSNSLIADNLPKIAILNAVSLKLMLFGLMIDDVHLMLSGHKEDASKQGRKILELDADEDVTLEEVDAEKDADETNEAEPAEVEEVLEVVIAAKLITEVVTTTTTTPITAAPVPKASALRRRRGVIIQDPEEAATASLSVQSEIKSKDKGKGILVEEPKPLKRQAQIEHDEAFARELEAELNANINWNKMDFFKGMTYTDIRPIFEKHFNSIWAFLEKGEKDIEEEDGKRKGKNLKQKAAKKQKIDEEVEELKTHLQIVPNDEDDVYTEATHLALKVLVVDYQIHTEHNIPYYKFIRADGIH